MPAMFAWVRFMLNKDSSDKAGAGAIASTCHE
jgi:hypothetical protein